MRNLFIRILKHGLPTALALALVGFVLGEVASIWVQGQSTQRANVEAIPYASTQPTTSDVEPITQGYRQRLPIMMALWGFGLIVVLEFLLFMFRGNGAKQELEPTPTPSHKDSTEELLNQLMAKAEAAEAQRLHKSA